MPEIIPAMPSAPAAPVVAASPVAPASADSTGTANFVDQLKAALKSLTSLTGGVTQQQTALQGQLVDPTAATGAPAHLADDHSDAPRIGAADSQSDAMPEALAALGLMLVSPLVKPLSIREQTATGGSAPAPVSAGAAGGPTELVPQRPSTSPGLAAEPTQPNAQPAMQPPAAAAAMPAQLTGDQAHSGPQPPPEAAKELVAAAHPWAPNALQAEDPHQVPEFAANMMPRVPQPTVSAQPGAADAAGLTGAARPSDGQASRVAPVAHHADGTPAAAQSTIQIVTSQPGAQHGGFGRGNFDDSRQPGAHRIAPADAAAPVAEPAAADATVATAAATTSANGAQLPANIRPSEVVSQIAHQADLYRLPGNRGVRIQLHPEDLGGVEVTLRYAAAGGIQLHINVEHAATGALVQAGWAELRDALATQGISPDRLVMSVTAAGQAGLPNFSSNSGNGYRSDAGLAGFSQGQSGQQRHEAQEQGGPRAWNDSIEASTSSTDDGPRTASREAASSRIDYRV